MLRISHCLNDKILSMCQKSVQLDDLEYKLRQYLPDVLKEKCKVGGLNKGCLLLVVDDIIWATPLRFLIPELRDNLRKQAQLHQLSSIKIQLNTTSVVPKKAFKITTQTLSASARETLTKAAQNCAHAPLKKALERLSNN